MIVISALYEVEPIGVNGAFEANGNVYRFCDNGPFGCRESFVHEHRDRKLVSGTDIDAIEGTVCDQCGVILIPETDN